MVFFIEIIHLKKIKDEAYIISLDEYVNVLTHWIALSFKKMKLFISIVLVLNIFLMEEFIKKFPGSKNIKTNIF